MVGLLLKGVKNIAAGHAQASLGVQSPHLPGAIVRIGRFLYIVAGVWIGGVWYSGYVNMRTQPGSGPKIILPGAPVVNNPDRPDAAAAWSNMGRNNNGGRNNNSSTPSPNTPAPNPKAVVGGGPTLASHPELKTGISRLTAYVLKQFPKLVITSTLRPGGTSYHALGRAADVASSDYGYMNQAAKWIATYLTGQLTEGIHNPGLSVKNGVTVPPSFWGAATWAEHANHIHLAV